MKKFKTIDSLSAKGQRILLRADMNVPMKDGSVSDMTRITRLAPTIRELADAGGRVIVLSHFGRPKGRDAALSLAPIGKALSETLGRPVAFVEDCIGAPAEQAVAAMKDGDILLLENVRFYPEEEKNDKEFAKKIAALGDAYVNDAFSCAHRAHATTEGIARLLPAYAGRLMEAELDALESTLENPQRPVMAIVGGAKISTKLDLLNNLVRKIDILVLGGGMANTFLAAQGVPMGKSLCERDMKDQANKIMEVARDNNCTLLLPVDGVMATEFKANAPHETSSADSIPEDSMMLDVGPETIANIRKKLQGTKTVLWNGPLGAFELQPFDAGTVALAKAVADDVGAGRLTAVAGGGDTVAALAHAGVEDKMTYVSTAGGAFLEWLEGKTLPGVAALQKAA